MTGGGAGAGGVGGGAGGGKEVTKLALNERVSNLHRICSMSCPEVKPKCLRSIEMNCASIVQGQVFVCPHS